MEQPLQSNKFSGLAISTIFVILLLAGCGGGGSDPATITYYAVGDTGPAGGIVFYTSDGGLHGLEAAPADLVRALTS